jgi:phospholipid/cholesterol/gamma-HCH transport system substrate-binding protein
MRLFSPEAKVGVVVFLALAALAWLTFQIGEFRFREKGYVIEAVFRTVSGLEPKAKVRMAGVLIGSVDRTYLKEGRAHVQLRIDDGVVVREDSVVAVSSVGILSERFIEITSGSLDARALAPGAVVAGRELMDLDQLIGQLTETGTSITALAKSISETFGGRDSTVSLLMRNTSSLVDRLNALIEDNRRQTAELIGQTAGLARDTRGLLADNRDELRGTIANLRDFSATLNQRADEVASEMTKTAEELRSVVRGGGDDLKTLAASLRAASDRTQQAAETLASILKKVDDGDGTLGRLVNDDEALAKIDHAVDQIGGIAAKINSGQGSIGRLVTDDRLVGKIESTVDAANRYLGESDSLRMFLGYRGEYLTRSGDVKNYVTMKFQPRDDKYYLLELVDDPAGKRSTINTTSTIARPEGGYQIDERTETVEVDKLKFSVLFVKDVGQLTFRAGLLESQGGAGLGYRLFDDRLQLSLDGWDFGREDGPHLKLEGKLKVYKDVFLNVGMDDLAAKRFRSVFVGAGILFSDEDLKYLMTLTKFSQ